MEWGGGGDQVNISLFLGGGGGGGGDQVNISLFLHKNMLLVLRLTEVTHTIYFCAEIRKISIFLLNKEP